jgi:hypothetical protein
MAFGPGKYDHLATVVRERAAAQAVVVIVINGARGSGFSVQVNSDVNLALVALLRTLADGIEQDLQGPPDVG